MKESSIEAACCRYAASCGVWPIKIWGGVTGDPDRGFVLPGHRFWPVEFKRPGGRLSPRQVQRHKELRALGIHVMVIDDTKYFKAWLDVLLEAVVYSGFTTKD